MSSVQQRNVVKVTWSVHVGRSNGAIIAQLNNVDDFQSCVIDNATASEVGILSVLMLRRESETFTVLAPLFYRNKAPTVRTVSPSDMAALSGLVEKLVPAAKTFTAHHFQ